MDHYYQNIDGMFNFMNIYSEMVKKFPDNSHFVEVGCWKGRSAVYLGVEIINSNKNIKLDCIDNWEFTDDIYTSNEELCAVKGVVFEEFLKNIEPLSSIISYHKLNSIKASELYENESLDFVFLDASHEYLNVKEDLIHWYPKVKFGGIIAGHDYCNSFKGVITAVDEYFNKNISPDKTSWIHYKN